MAEGHERLYAIKPDEGYFSAGVTPDGQQVLMGLFCPNLVAFYFDRKTLERYATIHRKRGRADEAEALEAQAKTIRAEWEHREATQ